MIAVTHKAVDSASTTNVPLAYFGFIAQGGKTQSDAAAANAWHFGDKIENVDHCTGAR